MPEWIVESSQLSDIGRHRRRNEDFVGCFEPSDQLSLASHGRLYVLADGVGGSTDGQIASQYAVKRILHAYFEAQKDSTQDMLRHAIETANLEVHAQNVTDDSLEHEMATTIVAAAICGQELTVANVGDSRAYLVRNGEIRQITRDHSLVAEMVVEGAITQKQAETHPYRNVILRSVGPHSEVAVDLFSCEISPGRILVLCSDGLTRHVSDREIATLAREHSPLEAVQRLVALANERGGEDNVTVSITRVLEQDLVDDRLTVNQAVMPQMPRWEEIQ